MTAERLSPEVVSDSSLSLFYWRKKTKNPPICQINSVSSKDHPQPSGRIGRLIAGWEELKGNLYSKVVDLVEKEPSRWAVVCCYIAAWQEHHDNPEVFEEALDAIPDLFNTTDRSQVETELMNMEEVSSDMPLQIKAPTIFAYIGNVLEEQAK